MGSQSALSCQRVSDHFSGVRVLDLAFPLGLLGKLVSLGRVSNPSSHAREVK
jgi:hypothetical protein